MCSDEIASTPFSVTVVKADPEKPDPKLGVVRHWDSIHLNALMIV